eukprot:CAMPEP_0204917126 /NCGR_PEP_ID=MMETSP1397-20131031/14802_1 /ASSEMBLY_ACC=CAM_ASM_000891 /TAXON_ID=49980 /ORGANISM="Climacostomum Climacostomum virens, Strain Stock W-24" /LENGTH=288 /DNA_ID=CAMNT_0052089891 /DNA_START=1 /DNA_END=867 /DNA_ORIENTATION=-
MHRSTQPFELKLNGSFTLSTVSESTKNSPRQSADMLFDISKLTMKDDGLSDIAEEMLSILHYTINKEFNVKAEVSNEELFNLPNDIQTCSIGEQFSFIKDLVFRVCRSYLQMLTPKDKDCLDSSPKILTSRRISKNKSIVLSEEDCEVLCELLKSPPRSSSNQNDNKSLDELQVKYKLLGQQLLESQAKLRNKEDEMEHLIDTNNRLRTGCKLMKQQIRSLERQLVDSMEENYKLEESLLNAKGDIAKLKAMNLIDAYSNDGLLSARSNAQSTPNFISSGRFSFSSYL